jgi:hypothetical protein
VNARGVTRLALPACGLALSAAAVFGTQGLRPVTDTVVTVPSSAERPAFTSNDNGGVDTGHLGIVSRVRAQQMAAGCERVRRPNCNRPGRRSTHR